MSATLTRHPETDAPVSDQAPAPKKVRRWILVAATVAIAGAIVSVTGANDESHRFAENGRHDALGRASQRVDASSDAAEFQRLLALAPQVDTSAQHAEDLRFAALGAGVDVSNQVAETQRMSGLAVTTATDPSYQFAETQRHLTLAVPAVRDGSSQYAEDLRFAAIGASVDTSTQYAETQRFLAAGAGDQVDTSNDVAEFERMRALEDTSWEDAEARRFATLDPSGN